MSWKFKVGKLACCEVGKLDGWEVERLVRCVLHVG